MTRLSLFYALDVIMSCVTKKILVFITFILLLLFGKRLTSKDFLFFYIIYIDNFLCLGNTTSAGKLFSSLLLLEILRHNVLFCLPWSIQNLREAKSSLEKIQV